MKRIFNLIGSAIALSPLALIGTMPSAALAYEDVIGVPEEKAFCRLTGPTSFEVVDKGHQSDGLHIVMFELKKGMYPFSNGTLDRSKIVAKDEAGRGMRADLQAKKCYVQPSAFFRQMYVYSLK